MTLKKIFGNFGRVIDFFSKMELALGIK